MKFRKKPVVIRAFHYHSEADFNLLRLFVGNDTPLHQMGDGVIGIETLEGVMRANPGDWIIQGIKGEHYPCKPDIFEATYEPAAEPAKTTISKASFWQSDSDKPEQGALDRFDDWRKENPDAVILGVQWSHGLRAATCHVTFEVTDEPVDPDKPTAESSRRTDRSIDLATRILSDPDVTVPTSGSER